MKYAILAAIRIYQISLSPDHGLFKYLIKSAKCRFYPTCSDYTYQAVRKYGLKGVLFGVKRIIKCSPLKNDGGYDPLL